MSATAETLVLRPAETAPLARAEGIELLGDVLGSGYARGAALVRRADGQVVQLGPLMYALLDEIDGERSNDELAAALCSRLDRACDAQAVAAIAEKLAAQGLLAGHEHNAPPRRNPLLALRWKVLVTDPKWTSRMTAPFTFLFRPFILFPVVACFLAVCWFVLFHKGIASATREAFDKPGLLLLVFALAVLSAGFHEVGHAAACRYGGATPGGMGMGLYLVWPAFYTDVTDAYRLPRRDRLRVDLGGIYFNVVVSVVTLGVWLLWRRDALLLLVALQLLMMVKNLSPVIRSDGYHILADATGVPDLYAHIGPTLKRLLPWRRRDASALTGRARLLVTVWVLIVTPVLLALLLGAILLLPRLLATAWHSGGVITGRMSHEGALGVLAGILQLVALGLPALGSLLVTQRLARGGLAKGFAWSAGRPVRRAFVILASAAIAAAAAWAWWPDGQYRPVQPYERGTLVGFARAPSPAVRPLDPVRLALAPGRHLAVAMIPVGGATKAHPAFYFVPGRDGEPGVGIIDTGAATQTAFPFTPPEGSAAASFPTTTSAYVSTTTTTTTTASGATRSSGSVHPGSNARAVNTTSGTVVYDVAYSLVTVRDGADVTNRNTAFARASCRACAAIAVSFQVVLVVGSSKDIAPQNVADAMNKDCPMCVSLAIADQIVVTLKSEPTDELVTKLQAALSRLDVLPTLTSAQAITGLVADVQKQIDDVLQASGQLANPPAPATTTTSTSATTTATTIAVTTATTTASTAPTPAPTNTQQLTPTTTAQHTTTAVEPTTTAATTGTTTASTTSVTTTAPTPATTTSP